MTPVPPIEELPLGPVAPWYMEHGDGIAVGIVVCAAALAMCALLAYGLLRATLAWRAARRRWGEPSRSDKYHIGDTVVVEGTLVVEGDGCERFDDGAQAAATTLEATPSWLSLSRPERASQQSARAGILVIDTGQRRFPIEGAVVVRAGSRQWWPASSMAKVAGREPVVEQLEDEPAEPPTRGHCVVRSVSAGDRVRARGRIARAPEHAKGRRGYRQAARGYMLEAGDAAVELCACQRPAFRTSFEALTTRGALSGVVLSMLALFIAQPRLLHGDEPAARYERAAELWRLRARILAAPPEPGATDTLLAIYQRQRDCRAEAELFISRRELAKGARHLLRCQTECSELRGQWDSDLKSGNNVLANRAKRALQSCKRADFAARATAVWMAAGQFAEASKSADGIATADCDGVVVAAKAKLLVGDAAGAATWLRHSGDCGSTPAAKRELHRCMARALSGEAIDPSGETGRTCGLVVASRVTGQARADALGGLKGTGFEGWLRTALRAEDYQAQQQLGWEPKPEAGGMGRSDMHSVWLMAGDRIPWGLERTLLKRLMKATELSEPLERIRYATMSSMARFELRAGDLEASRRWMEAYLAASVRDARTPDGWKEDAALPYDPAIVRGELALFARDHDAAIRALSLAPPRAIMNLHTPGRARWQAELAVAELHQLAAFMKSGRVKGVRDLLDARLKDRLEDETLAVSLEESYARTSSGDITTLLNECWAGRCNLQTLLPLYFASPRLMKQREPLLELLCHRGMSPLPQRGAAPNVEDTMFAATLTAGIAEQLGDAELAARERAIAARCRKALLRRETSVALALLH